MRFSVCVPPELELRRRKPSLFVMRMENNREMDDKTPHAEQYHLPVKTRSDHAPVRLAFVAPLHHLLQQSRLILLCSGRALGTCGCADAETVAELAGDGLEVSHAAGTGGLPSLGLLAPVDCYVLILAYGHAGVCALDNVHLRVLAAG
jgi:hypothetical protein